MAMTHTADTASPIVLRDDGAVARAYYGYWYWFSAGRA